MGRRVLAAIGTLWLVLTIVFFMLHLLPGNPAVMALSSMEGTATTQGIKALEKQMGLDKPLLVQYGDWVTGAVTGDLGTSLINHSSVSKTLNQRIPRSLVLVIPAMVFAILVGIPLGILSAVQRQTWVDPALSVVALAGFSIPIFVVGLLLVLLFGVHLLWLPSGGYVAFSRSPSQFLSHMAMPAFSLFLAPMAIIMRMTRSSILEAIQQDYVRTARSKGLTERVVTYKHVLRNSLIPVVTVTGIQAGYLFGGVVLAEEVFNWPGMGLLLITSVQQRDYPMVQGVVFVSALAFILINLVADISYGLLDPRVKYE